MALEIRRKGSGASSSRSPVVGIMKVWVLWVILPCLESVLFVSSVFWCCLLGDRKGIRPIEKPVQLIPKSAFLEQLEKQEQAETS